MKLLATFLDSYSVTLSNYSFTSADSAAGQMSMKSQKVGQRLRLCQTDRARLIGAAAHLFPHLCFLFGQKSARLYCVCSAHCDSEDLQLNDLTQAHRSFCLERQRLQRGQEKWWSSSAWYSIASSKLSSRSFSCSNLFLRLGFDLRFRFRKRLCLRILIFDPAFFRN